MPKKHRARKQQARREQRRTGAAYTSAQAGTTHSHPAPNMGMLTELPYIQGHPLQLDRATALVGACRAGCRSCQDSLTPLVAAHPATVAALAGAALGILPPGLSLFLGSETTRTWMPLLHEPPGGRTDAPVVALQEMEPEQVREVLEDGLDFWAVGGAPAPVIETLTLDQDDADHEPVYGVFVTHTPDETGALLPMLPLIPEENGASLEDLRNRCSLPAWDMNGLPTPAGEWCARFDIASRSLIEIARTDAEGFDDLVLCRPADQVTLPERWWDLLDRTSTVILCGAITDPDQMVADARAGQIVGVQARARFW